MTSSPKMQSKQKIFDQIHRMKTFQGQTWLLKSEPDTFSLDHLMKSDQQTTSWEGVRNFQARNYLRAMQLGDVGFFYHSSCAEPAIVGLVEVVRTAYPDPTSWNPDSPYYDPRSTKQESRWSTVDVRFIIEASNPLTLTSLRQHEELSALPLLKKGQRLSVQPVSHRECLFILNLM